MSSESRENCHGVSQKIFSTLSIQLKFFLMIYIYIYIYIVYDIKIIVNLLCCVVVVVLQGGSDDPGLGVLFWTKDPFTWSRNGRYIETRGSSLSWGYKSQFFIRGNKCSTENELPGYHIKKLIIMFIIIYYSSFSPILFLVYIRSYMDNWRTENLWRGVNTML